MPGENQGRGLCRAFRDEGLRPRDAVVERHSLLATPCRALTAGLRALRRQALRVPPKGQSNENVDEAWWEPGMIISHPVVASVNRTGHEKHSKAT